MIILFISTDEIMLGQLFALKDVGYYFSMVTIHSLFVLLMKCKYCFLNDEPLILTLNTSCIEKLHVCLYGENVLLWVLTSTMGNIDNMIVYGYHLFE